ncbi:acyltransferase [Tropicimonas sp. IMCC34043]|uniref:acyltransferase family protein n=1 Tax=Tropicimonas sp. IMCC34043 TaxID=2248760 RepID=UPI0013005841|nr:acyltransferase [Tropicimonas sp. IMCC34043]
MQKLESVQYLRAVAVLMVVAFHVHFRFPDAIPREAMPLLSVGEAGVDIFFVISGFIMWVVAERRPVAPAEFIMHRIIRIVPAYWIFTGLWVLLAVTGVFWWSVMTPAHILQSLLFIPHVNPTTQTFFPVLFVGWTLNYEMFFYLVFALCLMLRAEQRLAALCAILGALVIAGGFLAEKGPLVATYTDPLLLEFAMGVAAGYLWCRGRLPIGVPAAACLVLGVALMIVATLTLDDPMLMRLPAWGVPGLLVLIGMLGLPAAEAHHPWLRRIGDASYAIYLVHLFPQVLLELLFKHRLGLEASVPGAVVYMVLAFAASILLGILAYSWIEQPLQRAGCRLLLRHGKAAPAAPTAVPPPRLR